MKRLLSFSIVFLIIVVSCRSTFGYSALNQTNNRRLDIDYYVTVVGITDGDTFKGLTCQNVEVRYRIQGIDAPENRQAFSSKSKEKLSHLIFGKRVGVKVHTNRDRYGRPVVYVYTQDGLDIGAEMIKSGMAWHFKRYDNSTVYSQLEKLARINRIGLWQEKKPIPPWNYRRKR